MGAPMAGHLLDGNYELTTAVHRSPAPDWLIDKGELAPENRTGR